MNDLCSQAAAPFDLVVLVGGWTSRGRIPASFQAAVRAMLPDRAVLVCFDLDVGEVSFVDPAETCEALHAFITDAHRRHRPTRIAIIGFSAGTLIVRGAMLASLDAYKQDKTDDAGWMHKVGRVISLAGILRGWSISTATPAMLRFIGPPIRTALHVASSVLTAVRGRKTRSFIEQCERGEPFVVDLRLRTLAAMDWFAGVDFVYLLGTRDEFISPADAIDFTHFDNFHFREARGTNHEGMLQVDPAACPEGSDERADAADRLTKLAWALCEPSERLREQAIDREHINDYLDPMDRPHFDREEADKVRHAVIVLHGIRDNGFWTKRIARYVKETGGVAVVRAPSPSYGFFSILNFLNVSSRYEKTKWLLEQYADVKTTFPKAKISFVAHSNGTYLGAQAVQLCPSVRFERMYFAGSVVRTDFPWNSFADRVGEVVNVTTDTDVVVACAPAFAEDVGIGFLKVGGAGVYGFQRVTSDRVTRNVGPVAGGHGQAISERYWEPIAGYIAGGGFELPEATTAEIDPVWVWGVRAALSALAAGLLALLALAVFVDAAWIWAAALAWFFAVQIARFY